MSIDNLNKEVKELYEEREIETYQFYKLRLLGHIAQSLKIIEAHQLKEDLRPANIIAKKIDIAEKHSISKIRCKYCNGNVTWDMFKKGDPVYGHPFHVDDEGIIIGDGGCPNYER